MKKFNIFSRSFALFCIFSLIYDRVDCSLQSGCWWMTKSEEIRACGSEKKNPHSILLYSIWYLNDFIKCKVCLFFLSSHCFAFFFFFSLSLFYRLLMPILFVLSGYYLQVGFAYLYWFLSLRTCLDLRNPRDQVIWLSLLRLQS